MLKPGAAMSRVVSAQAVAITTFRRRPAANAVLVSLAAVPLLVLAAAALFELANWDKVTPGVSALGNSVGGMSKTEAVARLTPSVEQLLDRPLDIRSGDQTWRTSARDLGLRLDPNELVGAAYQIGRQGSPFDRFGDQVDAALHGRIVSAASTTDRPALDASLAAMARQVERPPANARLGLSGTGEILASPAQDGLAVDLAASRDHLNAALNGEGSTVELVTSRVPPAIADDQVQAAHDQLDRLLAPDAQPLTATFGDQSWQLTRAETAKLISLSGGTQPGQPAVVNVDDAPLRAWAGRLAKEVDQTVQNARFAFNGGNLKVLRPSRQGRSLDQDGTVQVMQAALLAGEHTVSLPVVVVEPTIPSTDPQALGITELIDRGTTSFAGSIPEKKHNIQLAAQRLNGVVVPPGGTFSFNDAVGPTTIDSGFQWGFGIASGDNGPRTVPSVAGGICQVATTLFQPVFWAGYPLEERFWHLYWIPAYTSRGVVGLDVTVDGDAGLDFKWTNPTRDYVLIQSDADEQNIYFGLYGKKPSWRVQVDDAIITNRTPPDTRPIAQEEPSLPWGRVLAVESARDGFDAEVVRRVIPADGSKPRELDLKSTYQPAHTVTLVGTAGKPASASVQDAIQRVLDAQKPPEPKPGPTVAAAATVVPAATLAAPTAQPAVQATAVPATQQPAVAPTAARGNQAPTATARATTKPATGQANNTGIAPTPSPAR